MIQQGFHIGDRDWWCMVYYDVRTESDLNEVYKALLASGCPNHRAQKACMELSRYNTGYTYTNFDERLTIMAMSKATSAEQMFDTMNHEIKHFVEHLSTYYDLDPKEELSAYLQGEVGRLMFPAAAMAICPKCSKD